MGRHNNLHIDGKEGSHQHRVGAGSHWPRQGQRKKLALQSLPPVVLQKAGHSPGVQRYELREVAGQGE